MFHLRDKNLDINRISQITFQETVCGLVKHCALGSVTKAIQDFINFVFHRGADKMRICWTQNIALTP